MEVKEKVCTKCGAAYPATLEYWYAHGCGKYGLKSICKKCVLEYQRNNKEIFAANNKKYREKNYEKLKEYHKKYYEKNKLNKKLSPTNKQALEYKEE